MTLYEGIITIQVFAAAPYKLAEFGIRHHFHLSEFPETLIKIPAIHGTVIIKTTGNMGE